MWTSAQGARLACAGALLLFTTADLSLGCKASETSAAAVVPPPSSAAKAAKAEDAAAAKTEDAGEEDPTGGGTIGVVPPASAAPSAAPSPAAPDASSMLRPRDDLPGLSNFARVSDALYRGAQPTAEGFRTLKKMGVKTVINLRSSHSDRPLLAGTGLQYVHIRALAWHPEDEDIAQALRIIRDPANQPAFVHCQHGADRTGVTIAAYRIVEQGWTTSMASAELPSFHFHPIWTQVIAYLGRFDGAAMKQKITALSPVKVEIVP
jgi:protein tyrosine phosphatase (PTP) superfamily phosphohydrolase (DUF442 family)